VVRQGDRDRSRLRAGARLAVLLARRARPMAQRRLPGRMPGQRTTAWTAPSGRSSSTRPTPRPIASWAP
jgi:hypothetical protein